MKEFELEIKKYKEYYKSKFNETKDLKKIKDILLEDFDKFIKFLSKKFNVTIDYEIESENKFTYNLRTCIITEEKRIRTYFYSLEPDRLYTECYCNKDRIGFYSSNYDHHTDIYENLNLSERDEGEEEMQKIVIEYINTMISKEEKEKISEVINKEFIEEIKENYTKKRRI